MSGAKPVLDGCVLHGRDPQRTCVGCGRVLGPFWWKSRERYVRSKK